MKRYIKKFMPNFLRLPLLKIYHSFGDAIHRLKVGNDMIPPSRMIFVGDGDFQKIGKQCRSKLIKLANLQPNMRVLDVGCGIGRMAIPLTDYLSEEGEYWGIDIVKEGIDWCQKRISSKFSNFHFIHTDVHNKNYNKNGRILAKDFRFPFNDNFFDLVFLTSVFTHMLPSDLENYLSEISRVLKVQKRCFITFYILNKESRESISLGKSDIDFKYKIEDCLTTNEENPEDVIAYKEDFVERLFEKYGFKIILPIHYGSWCKRNNCLGYQDLVIAVKK